MDNPNQHLVHLTSRGPKVYGQDGAVGKFKCVTTQPLKDINKFGLLHYSIPKTLDPLTSANNQFTLRLRFLGQDNAQRRVIDVPVTLPELDYNNVLYSSDVDYTYNDAIPISLDRNFLQRQNTGHPPQRNKERLHFDEILQSSINWALQEKYDEYDGGGGAPQGTIAQQCLARIGCVVTYDRKDARYMFHLGYRGYAALQNDADPWRRGYAAGVIANSGAPFPVVANANIGIAASPNGQYTFRTPRGYLRNNADPCHDINNNYLRANLDQARLTGFEFHDLSPRLQLMMGAGAASLAHTATHGADVTFTRGRIRLVNYTSADASDQPGYRGQSGLFSLEMTVRPNLDPPSMLYLQLTVPGTRTKILGQQDERGGWAIPTPSNSFMSKWDNLPNGGTYTQNQSRSMPIIDATPAVPAAGLTTAIRDYFQTRMPANPPAAVQARFGDSYKRYIRNGLGYNYDPIPAAGTTAVNVGAGVMLAPVNDYGPQTCKFIKFKKKSEFHKRFRATPKSTLGRQPSDAYRVGVTRTNPVFTTSMIEPNWIYTQTTDSTIQTFDIELLWGDTSEPVHDFDGHPVQLSIIASS